MSQLGTVVSANPQIGSQAGVPANNWVIDFQFVRDDNSIGTAQVRVGSGPFANVAFWSSPNSTISVTAPGYTGNILLNVPDLIRFAASA